MHTTRRRRVVALIATLAALALLTTPAAAHVHPANVTAGDLTLVNATGTQSSTGILGGTVGAGCGTTATIDVDHTANTGNLTQLTGTSHLQPTGSSTHYVVTSTRTASTSGTVSQTATSGTITNLGVSLNLAIRAAANNSSTNYDCATTGAVLCTLRATFSLSGTYDHTGTGSIGTSQTAILNASSTPLTLAPGTCQVPFSAYNGGSASITTFSAHLVDLVTTHPASVTAGTFTGHNTTSTSTSTGTLNSTGAGCTSSTTDSTTLSVNQTAGTGNITQFANTFHFTLNSTHYVATSTRSASTNGTFTPGAAPNGTVANLGLSLNIVIRAAANNGSTDLGCATTGTSLCTLRAVFSLTGTYTFTGTTGLPITSSDTLTLGATTTLTLGIGTCQVPFSTFNGGTATISNMTLHI